MLNDLMILSWCLANQSFLCKISTYDFMFGRIGILDPENANAVYHIMLKSPSPHFCIKLASWA